MNRQIVLFNLFIFLSLSIFSQAFTSEIKKDKITVEGKSRSGYSTYFDYPADEVARGWWKYSRAFSRSRNMKLYYEVTVPSEINTGNVDIKLFAKSINEKGGSRFHLTLNDDNIPEQKVADYLPQIAVIIKDFKQAYYIDRLEDDLTDATKRAKVLGRKINRAGTQEKKTYLRQLSELENKMESTISQLQEIYQAY